MKHLAHEYGLMVAMRWILTLTATLAVAAVHAQTVDLRIRSGLAYWTNSPNLRMRIQGTQTLGTTQTIVQGYLNCTETSDAAGRIVPLVEVVEAWDGKLRQRVVGDGETMFAYNPIRQEVQSSVYIPETAGAGDVLNKLGTGLAAVAEGFTSYTVRIYNDLFHPSGPQYKPWMPGRPAQVLNVMGTYKDPLVPTRNYLVNPAVDFVMFTYGEPVQRNVVYEFDKSGSTEFVAAIYVAEQKRIGSHDQLTDLVIRFENPISFAKGTFTFVPPTRARMIAGPKLIP